MLDLGAGDGALTRPLAATGAQVVAFELHPERAAALRRTVGGRVEVVRADVRDLRLPRRPVRVVADPPFDGVSSVLDRLTSRGSRLERADLVVPRSVARRWAARLHDGGEWRAVVAAILPRSAFSPRPRVDCCVLVVERRRGR